MGPARQLDAAECSAHPCDRRALLAPEQPNTERRIAALMAANPELCSWGYFCGDHTDWSEYEYAWWRHRFILDRESASVTLVHVDAFEWVRVFLALGCRRLTTARSRKSVMSDGLAHAAEDAAMVALGRHVEVGIGIAILAAMSLGIDVKRAGRSPNALIAARIVWGGSA